MLIEEERLLPPNKETVMALDTPVIIKNNEIIRGKFSLCEADPPRKVSIRCIEVTNEQEQTTSTHISSYNGRMAAW